MKKEKKKEKRRGGGDCRTGIRIPEDRRKVAMYGYSNVMTGPFLEHAFAVQWRYVVIRADAMYGTVIWLMRMDGS